MRNAAIARDIERIGSINNSVKFGINANNARAFKVLSSTLYRDKILAVVREYSCNSRDSHIMAGVGDEPFFVHLPNALEPFFSVKDNGLGLSDESVQKIWTSYFTSTKNEDCPDPQGVAPQKKTPTGTLGLGSKSGFSYVDSFTLISRYNGEKRVYTSFINEGGCPEIVAMGDPEITDERNGVEVIIPVGNASDYREFRQRAEQIYELFEPMPVVTGSANFAAPQRKIVLSGTGWHLRDHAYGRARAIMGSLAYPIYSESIQNINENARRLLNAPIDIDFEMDKLDFTAGREELSYDQDITQPALRARLDAVYEEIKAVVETEFKECSSEFAARRKYAEFFCKDRYNSPLRDIIGGAVKWNGKVINNSDFAVPVTDLSGSFAIETLRMAEIHKRRIGRTKVIRRMKTAKKHMSSTYQLSTEKNILPVILDLQKDYVSRLRHYLSQNETKEIVLVMGTSEDIAAFRQNVDGCEFTLASALPKPERTTVRRKTRVRGLGNKNFEFKSMSYEWMTSEDVDLSVGGTYVALSKGKIIGFDDNSCFFDLHTKAQLAKLIQEEIFVFPQSLLKKIENDPLWVNYQDKLKMAVEMLIKRPETEKAVAAEKTITALKMCNLYDWANGKMFPSRFMNALASSHPIKETIRAFDSIKSAANDPTLKQIVMLATQFELIGGENVNDFTADMLAIKEAYPMLFFVFAEYRNNGSAAEAAIDYVKLVDASKDIAIA